MITPTFSPYYSHLKDSQTSVEESIYELMTICYGFKCLSEVPIDQEFFTSGEFDSWHGLLYFLCDSFRDRVFTLKDEFNSLSEAVGELRKALSTDN